MLDVIIRFHCGCKLQCDRPHRFTNDEMNAVLNEKFKCPLHPSFHAYSLSETYNTEKR